LEVELEEALEQIARLQQQKKLWRQRIIYTIFRRVSNLEELECTEVEERAQAIVETIAMNIEQAGLTSEKSDSIGVEGQYQTNL
jgi:hypothetical protein